MNLCMCVYIYIYIYRSAPEVSTRAQQGGRAAAAALEVLGPI